jgi:hypothetical protein
MCEDELPITVTAALTVRGMDEVAGTGCGAGPERAECSGILH